MKGDWNTCLAQWELIKGNYAFPILCGIENTICRLSGMIQQIDIVHHDRDPDKTIIKLKIKPDIGELKKLTITSEKPFFFKNGRDKNGKLVFLSEEFNK